MKTIPARTAKRWLSDMNEIYAALELAENMCGPNDMSNWRTIWEAKARTNGIRDGFMDFVVADVAVEGEPT